MSSFVNILDVSFRNELSIEYLELLFITNELKIIWGDVSWRSDLFPDPDMLKVRNELSSEYLVFIIYELKIIWGDLFQFLFINLHLTFIF